MKCGFLYAGQGTQRVGMGADFYDKYPAFREVFDKPELDFDLKRVCFEGPEETLSLTAYTQPCMVAFAAGVTELFKNAGIVPEVAAGLSLGEYSALCAAGVFNPKTAVELTAFRGKVMTEAAKGRTCSMAAVMNLDRNKLQEACTNASSLGVCEIANYNCPGQIVIGGDTEAVNKACELAKEAGAKRCIPLKVSGPFHTSLMKPAGDALKQRFLATEFSAPHFPVIFNATGKTLAEGETIPSLLVKQVQSSVYLEDSIRLMEQMGVDTVVEIGPGKALSGFVRKTAGTINTIPVETAEDFEAAVAALKGELAI